MRRGCKKSVAETVVRQQLQESASSTSRLPVAEILLAAEVMATSLRHGGKILLCGNGGSAADAQHVATEFVGRLYASRVRRALPAMALSSDVATLTALGNDYGFEQIFARQVEAHGTTGDVLVALSTSGNSPNLVEAVQVARLREVKTIGLLGMSGRLLELVDIALCVPSSNSARIQEGHIVACHIMCDLVERLLFGEETDFEVRTS
jgi:D-sedoheptulose 7-phosphate isomerase